MHGWKGKILRVDLNTRSMNEEKLNPDIAKDTIGGRGLGI